MKKEFSPLPLEKWFFKYPAMGFCIECPLVHLAHKRILECEKAFHEEWEDSLEYLKETFRKVRCHHTDEWVYDCAPDDGCIDPVFEDPDAPAALKQAMVGHRSSLWLMGYDALDQKLGIFEPSGESILNCMATCAGCHLVVAFKRLERSFNHLFEGDFEYWGHRIEYIDDDFGQSGTLLHPTKSQPGENWWTYGSFLKRIHTLRMILSAEENWGGTVKEGV